LEQVVARLSVEKAELLLDLKMYKAELERRDKMPWLLVEEYEGP
jgi:hypothetical protein